MPVTRARRRAESGVTARFPRVISLRRGNDTPNRTAKADCEMLSGLRNSSRSISPGCVGGWCVGSLRTTSRGARRLGLVVVRNLDLVRIATLPTKAHSILLVDPDAVLTGAFAREALQTVAGRYREFAQIPHAIELRELPARHPPQRRRTCTAGTPILDAVEDVLGRAIGKRPYHRIYYS